MLSVKLQRERYETIISGKLLQGWRKGCLLFVMNRRASPDRDLQVFSFRLMTSINQARVRFALVLMEGAASRAIIPFVPGITFGRTWAHAFDVLCHSRVQIYIFSPSANFSSTASASISSPFAFCEILLLLLKPIKQRLLKEYNVHVERSAKYVKKNDKSLRIQ